MLVLSRKVNEKIMLQVDGMVEPIELTVIRIDRNKVRLGIDATPGVTILRAELYSGCTLSDGLNFKRHEEIVD